MSDWEEVVVFEMESDFLLSKTAVIWLESVSTALRRRNNGGCNKLADVCDVAAARIETRMGRKLLERANIVGRHRKVTRNG